MNRSSAYYRRQRILHINRKKKIIKEQNNYWHYRHEGELSKGKIHCSCPMCAAKSKIDSKMCDKKRAWKHVGMLEDCANDFYVKPYISKIISRTKHMDYVD